MSLTICYVRGTMVPFPRGGFLALYQPLTTSTAMQSLWLVSHNGTAVRLFSSRLAAIDSVIRALCLRLGPTSPLYRTSLLQVGVVSTECGVWRVESIPVAGSIQD